ncbi:peptidyl-prolyl cis-trans isomerase CYP57-like [Asparagus officinalis]|nr:peptidyl-prolyl cis-trans isomerase CYP57-like [Asparagus officinalis]
MKKKGMGSEGRAEHMAKADTDLQLLSKADKERQLHKLKKRRLHGREEDTLARLEKFKNSISKKIDVSASSNSKGNDEDDESGWISNRLTFVRDHSGKDDMTRRDDPNEYVVLDPLLEKGKEKFNKMQAKLKRRDREWAGRSLT